MKNPADPLPSDSGNPPTPIGAAPATPPPRPRRVRRWLTRLGAISLAVLLCAGIGLAGAEHYTAQPQFCGSCHIMDPYYESWHADVHGAKIGVRCVDCHYAPGERFTIKAKFKGLSQVASYFSGRYGAGRPRAHVADDSCLRSGCHGDHAFMPKLLPIGKPQIETRLVGGREVEMQRPASVHFVHHKHLEADEQRDQVGRELAALRTRLEAGLAPGLWPRLQAELTSIRPAAERIAALARFANGNGLSPEIERQAREWMDLEHRRIRLDQLAGLSCSACHAFNPSLSSHIAADRSVCFTCHFTNESFNQNTGECLRCHEPPTRSVQIHATGGASAPSTAVMDHQDIVKRNVDCASCHADVLRGEAVVSERDCIRCHDQSHFLADFKGRTTETVRKYHEVHIAGQKAHCFDCHRAIDHGLVPANSNSLTQAGFLEPVLNDCQHCHPNHHQEQVSLLSGTGGRGLAHAVPNGMLGSRINCRACHTQASEDAKGDTLIRATQQGCLACHGEDYLKLFDQWKHELEGYLREASATQDRLTAAVERRKTAGNLPEKAVTLLDAAKHNIGLVRSGGALHNRVFALQLLDVARRDMQELDALLSKQ